MQFARICLGRICFLLILVIIFTGSGRADDSNDSLVGKVYKENIDAVVSVIAYDSNSQPISQGSGFVISSSGRVVTNQHVISGATSFTVKMHSGAFYSAAGVSAVDCSADLAVLDLAAKGVTFSHVEMAKQPGLEIGDPVVVIGTPLLLESSVSDGIVSGIRMLPGQSVKYFQTTAPVSSGNSGGPLFDASGTVVGVVTFKFDGGENINFAISSESVFELSPYSSDSPFVKAESYLAQSEYSCDSSNEPAIAESPEHSTISGTYTGVWQSNGGHSGVALMTVALDGNTVNGKISITGSPLGYTGDEFLGKVDEFADGVWTVSLRTNDNKMKATAVFSGNDLIGDYSFRFRLIGRDRGRWILQRR